MKSLTSFRYLYTFREKLLCSRHASLATQTGQKCSNCCLFLGSCIRLRGNNYHVVDETILVHAGLQAKADAQGFTALHVASNRGLLRITAALVKGGADMNSKDNEGDTPLLAALAGG